MSGPSVTTGEGSKQDYGTPWGFVRGPVAKRFGPISFDLAAHADNAKHERYFAPASFTARGTKAEAELEALSWPKTANLSCMGWRSTGKRNKKGVEIFDLLAPNDDANAFGIDALTHDWAGVALKLDGPLWLNCPFSDIEPWAGKCSSEGARGADILLLVPVAISNWWRDLCAGRADTYLMNGRLSFDGKNPYPKDLMLCHFGPRAKGRVLLWRHAEDEIYRTWDLR